MHGNNNSLNRLQESETPLIGVERKKEVNSLEVKQESKSLNILKAREWTSGEVHGRKKGVYSS